jgi:hypothetical protein
MFVDYSSCSSQNFGVDQEPKKNKILRWSPDHSLYDLYDTVRLQSEKYRENMIKLLKYYSWVRKKHYCCITILNKTAMKHAGYPQTFSKKSMSTMTSGRPLRAFPIVKGNDRGEHIR